MADVSPRAIADLWRGEGLEDRRRFFLLLMREGCIEPEDVTPFTEEEMANTLCESLALGFWDGGPTERGLELARLLEGGDA